MPCHFWQSYQLILVGANLLCIALTNRILKRDEKTFSWFEIPRLPQNPLTLSEFCETSYISVPIDLKWNVWTPNFWKRIAVPWTETRFLCFQCCQSPEDILYRWISTSIWEISGIIPSNQAQLPLLRVLGKDCLPLTIISYYFYILWDALSLIRSQTIWNISFNSIAAKVNHTLNTTKNTITTISRPCSDFCFDKHESLGGATLHLDQ